MAEGRPAGTAAGGAAIAGKTAMDCFLKTSIYYKEESTNNPISVVLARWTADLQG